MYGLVTVADDGCEMAARKPTTLLTNMPAVASYVNLKCDGSHSHCHLQGHAPGFGKRTQRAQEYPLGFVRAVLRAVKKQKEWDHRGLFLLGTVGRDDDSTKDLATPPEETVEFPGAMAWDDNT